MQYQQIYGVFGNIENAERAISALKDHGASGNEISVVRRSDGKGMAGVEEGGSHGITVTTAEDATAGALKGGAAGIALGVLAGAVMLTIPGVGPILAAGPRWAAFGAAAAAGAAGAALGGVVGYLVDQGVPSDKAHVYAGAIHRGDMLVSVRSNHMMAGEAAILLEKYGATEIGQHTIGDPMDGANEPSVADLAATEREQAMQAKEHPASANPAAIAYAMPIQDALTQDALEEEARHPDAMPVTLSPITPSMPALPGPIGR
ncbi:MAG: hypothetical protein H7145_12030 [Akkermansiaceae bacterium]|nr:hypothetical protein [Armatimonadota bacterium]